MDKRTKARLGAIHYRINSVAKELYDLLDELEEVLEDA